MARPRYIHKVLSWSSPNPLRHQQTGLDARHRRARKGVNRSRLGSLGKDVAVLGPRHPAVVVVGEDGKVREARRRRAHTASTSMGSALLSLTLRRNRRLFEKVVVASEMEEEGLGSAYDELGRGLGGWYRTPGGPPSVSRMVSGWERRVWATLLASKKLPGDRCRQGAPPAHAPLAGDGYVNHHLLVAGDDGKSAQSSCGNTAMRWLSLW